MWKPSRNDFPNATARFFYNLNLISFFNGQTNFWIEDLAIPKRFLIFHRLYSLIITVFIYVFILSEFAAPFTQKNLTSKQESDILIFIISHPMLWSYSVIFCRQADKVKKILGDILKLKKVYNDTRVERQMMKKATLFSLAFVGLCGTSMLMFSFDGVMQVIKKEGTYTTVINVWPMVDDTSASANILRFIWNFLWWSMISRVIVIYAFVFSLTSSMTYQFINLHSYFNSLNDIFTNNHMSQTHKEMKYEEAYKIGIKLHLDTLDIVNLGKEICGWLFSGQIIFNVAMLVIMLVELLTAERDVMHTGAIGLAAFGVIMATGLFMCNAGNVTVEASELCTAMYSSGWQYCQGQSSVRVRKLVMTSMVYAQRPVVIEGLGIIPLSYQSYVSLVKSTYSLFSLVFQQAP